MKNPDRNILFGLDGATFSVLDDLVSRGFMPHFAKFMMRGVRAKLMSTVNYLTPPAWTSMITGCVPGRHGIFDFIQPIENDRGLYFKLNDARDIQCDTVWSILSDQGKSVVSLNFPVSFPPRPILGHVMAGWVTPRHFYNMVYPRELAQELKKLPGFDIKSVAWDMEKEKKAIQTVGPEEYESWIDFQLRRQQQWATLVEHFLTMHPSDVTGFVEDGADKLQHLAWRFLDPSLLPQLTSTWELHIRNMCVEYFQRIDDLLARVLHLTADEARIYIASDHGFCGTQLIFYINVWLEQHGYLAWRKDSPVDDSENIAAETMKNQYEMFDWQGTVAYSPTPSCRGIYIRRKHSRAASQTDYEALRRELAIQLLAFRDHESGARLVERVLTREEAFPGSQAERAPDLTVYLSDHSFPSVLNSGMVTRVRRHVAGTHHPDGIFVAAGNGIRQGHLAEPLSIMDICPILLYSAQAAIPAGLDGTLREDIFDPMFMQRFPPRYLESNGAVSSVDVDRNRSGPALDKADETAILEKLTVLGYLE